MKYTMKDYTEIDPRDIGSATGIQHRASGATVECESISLFFCSVDSHYRVLVKGWNLTSVYSAADWKLIRIAEHDVKPETPTAYTPISASDINSNTAIQNIKTKAIVECSYIFPRLSDHVYLIAVKGQDKVTQWSAKLWNLIDLTEHDVKPEPVSSELALTVEKYNKANVLANKELSMYCVENELHDMLALLSEQALNHKSFVKQINNKLNRDN